MKTPTPEQINEIAENLECGFRCFWNRKTGELVSLPDNRDPHYYDDEGLLDEEYDRVDAEGDDFLEFEKPGSGASYQIMEDFAHSLKNKGLKNRLLAALDKRKPFREFKHVVDNAGDYRDDWFAFRRSKFRELVQEQIEWMLEQERQDEEKR